MKKYLSIIALIMCVVLASCSGDKKQETQKQVQEKPKPTIIGDWYGVKYQSQPFSPESLLAFPIAKGAPNHCYGFYYISFKEDGKLALFQTPNNPYLEVKYEYKWIDKGDYLAVTDEFDRPTDIILQISELTDSAFVLRYNEGRTDVYIAYSKNPDKRREFFEFYFNGCLKDEYKKDMNKYKDNDEWKADKELYRMEL